MTIDSKDEIPRINKKDRNVSNPSREDFHRGRILEDAKTLSPEELARKYAKILTQLESERFIDNLTGLWTLTGGKHVLGSEIALAAREKHNLAVFMLDLDGFKAINEEMGHQKGNEAIKLMAGTLFKSLRRNIDTPARYGGDEFFIVVPIRNLKEGQNPDTIAQLVGNRVRVGVADAMQGGGFNVTTSLGYTLLGEGNKNVPQLIEEADSALKLAKLAGKNQVVKYTKEAVK